MNADSQLQQGCFGLRGHFGFLAAQGLEQSCRLLPAKEAGQRRSHCKDVILPSPPFPPSTGGQSSETAVQRELARSKDAFSRATDAQQVEAAAAEVHRSHCMLRFLRSSRATLAFWLLPPPHFTTLGPPLQGRDRRWEAGAAQALARLREQQLDLQASSRR